MKHMALMWSSFAPIRLPDPRTVQRCSHAHHQNPPNSSILARSSSGEPQASGLERLPQLHVGLMQPTDSLVIELAGFLKMKKNLAALLEGDTCILGFALVPKKFTQGELSTGKGLIKLMALGMKLPELAHNGARLFV